MSDTPSQTFSVTLEKLAKAIDAALFDTTTPTIAALKGGWGEGKTYFWKRTIAANRKDRKPGYVSVFGAESLATIQREVMIEAVRTRVADDDLYAKIKKVFPLLRAASTFKDKIKGWLKIPDIPLPADLVSEMLQHVVFREGWVLCLDDIERLPESIGLDALFGYVNSLREDRKINVILIYNEDRITESRGESLRRYTEKVVDREFTFEPTTIEIARLAFGTELLAPQLFETVANKCETLGLRNIRILIRAKRYYEEAAEALAKDASPQYLDSVLSSLLLFSWSKFARVEARDLTLDFLENYQGIPLFDDDDKKDQDWRQALLDRYQYRLSDDMDRVLIRFVEKSILDGEQLNAHYATYVEDARRERARARLDEAWDIFHGSFSDTRIAFGDALHAAITEDMKYIPISRIDHALVALEKLGRHGDAKNIIRQLEREYPNRLERFDDVVGELTHGALLERVANAKRKAAIDARPLDEVISSIALNSDEFISLPDRTRLAAFSVDDVVDYFLSTTRENLTAVLRHIVHITRIRGSDEYDAKINQTFLDAAQIIADTNEYNRDRIAAMKLLAKDGTNADDDGTD